MKKLVIVVSILLLLVLPLGISGCSNAAEQISSESVAPTPEVKSATTGQPQAGPSNQPEEETTAQLETEIAEVPEETKVPVESHWEKAYYVDDFNDPTDDWYLHGTFSGNFSNSATAGSPLTVHAFFDKYLDSASYDMFRIRLIEYNSSIANFDLYDEDDIIFKVKVDGTVYEDTVNDILDNDLCIERGNTLFRAIIDALENENEISCVIEASHYTTSTYRFTLDSNGLSDIPHSWKSEI